MQPRADQSRSGGPSQGRRPGGDRASRPRRARKPRENNYEADDEDGQRPRDELDDDENSEANQQKRIIDQSYFEEPDRPVVPHDPSPAADLASYEHPGMPTLSTGNAYGQSRMLSRILGSSSSDVQLPRREAFDTYEAALQTPIGRGGFVHLPEGQDPKELEGKTWAWKDKERRFTQQWQVSPVEGEQLKMLGEKYIAGRYELAGKPETDPTREIVRRAAAAVGRNGSYGIKDGRQFMDKIRELMPKPAKV